MKYHHFKFSNLKKIKTKRFRIQVGISVKSNIVDYNIVNVKSEIKKWLTENLTYMNYKHEYYNEKEDFQFKVGLGVKL